MVVVGVSRRLGLRFAVDRQREVDQYRCPHARQRCEQEENLPRVDGREPANESFAPPFPRINKNRCAMWSDQRLVLTQGLLLQLRRHNFDDKFFRQILLLLLAAAAAPPLHPVRTLTRQGPDHLRTPRAAFIRRLRKALDIQYRIIGSSVHARDRGALPTGSLELEADINLLSFLHFPTDSKHSTTLLSIYLSSESGVGVGRSRSVRLDLRRAVAGSEAAARGGRGGAAAER
uniref:Uncharacterized protein n=1 Tax=Zea mays TaxID=4577 RepID=C4IY79_MAIZE|nr:unknown [Zea mays]